MTNCISWLLHRRGGAGISQSSGYVEFSPRSHSNEDDDQDQTSYIEDDVVDEKQHIKSDGIEMCSNIMLM